jgi:inhibitor of KinA sporulation pathway (predicted exonuclease)
MPTLPSEFILFDLEFTSWEGAMERGWSGPGEYREIIQIGAVRVDDSHAEKESFLAYIKPVRNPELSPFIIELTGITQKDIEERGVSFADALRSFREFVGTTPGYAWGNDTEVLEENCGFADIRAEFPPDQFLDLRPLTADAFRSAGVDIERWTSGTLIQAFGPNHSLRAHDALNDMRNLLAALNELKNRIGTSRNS